MSLITTGAQLTTFCTSLNGGASIDETLLGTLLNTARAILEAERAWMVLRKTNTSLSLTTANTWETAKSLATITDFSRFYGEYPVVLFDGTNRTHKFAQAPFDRRLDYKDVSDRFVFDENGNNLYFGGTLPFAGTLYIHYVADSGEVDPASAGAVWTAFPSRFLPILGFYAVGIHKGAVDYDDINRLMLPEHRATLRALKNAMESWDNERQLSTIEHNDPTDLYSYPRSGAIDRNA